MSIFMDHVLGPEEQWGDLRILNQGNDMVRNIFYRSSQYGSVVMNPTSIHEDLCSIPGFDQWVKEPVLP